MKEKLVSIVLPTYNGERYIKESIDSLLSQTYTNWELIIVNDHSSDNTANIIASYNDSRIKVLTNEENLKVPASLNKGFSVASGEYYTWTSDDNRFKPKALEYMVNYLENHAETDFVSCNFDYIDENGDFCRNFANNWNRKVNNLWTGCNIGACFLYRKTIAQKVGLYDTHMFCAEDFDYWCRIALAGNVSYSKETLYEYRINRQALSYKKKDLMNQQAEKINLQYAPYFFIKYKVKPIEQVKLYAQLYKKTNNIEFKKRAIQINYFYYFLVSFNLKKIFQGIFSIKNLYNGSQKQKILTILFIKFEKQGKNLIRIKSNKVKSKDLSYEKE